VRINNFSILIPWFLLFFANLTLASERLLIHEPYWEENEKSLEIYAKRLLKTISSHLIEENQIDRPNKQILYGNERVSVRKIGEFGRVLPNIFLEHVLVSTDNNSKAVPRIFLYIKEGTSISFEFLLPHHNMRCDSGHNCIQVKSDSFEIFQEYIDGDGDVGDKSFFPFGHADFNARQIITSKRDGKKYLIDTKEEKNFFLPQLSPYKESFSSYWLFKIGRRVPQNEVSFHLWQLEQRKLMIRNAKKNFGGEIKSKLIVLGKLDEIDMKGISSLYYANTIFKDDKESERYFADPKANVARYLYFGRYDLFEQLLSEHMGLRLDGVTVPVMDGVSSYTLNPVQFILRSGNLSNEEKHRFLKQFSKEKDYFTSSSAQGDSDKWPLYLALATGDKAIFSLVVAGGANINDKVRARSALSLSLNKFAGTIESKAKEQMLAISQEILDISDQDTIKETMIELFRTEKGSTFSAMTTESRISLAKMLLDRLHFIPKPLIKKIFHFGDRSLIEQIIESKFDYEAMLMSAMELINDPVHDYIRMALGDKSPIDYYWYGLVNKILMVKSKYSEAEDAIDRAIDYALVNSKVQILCELLKHIPKDAPRMNRRLAEIKDSTYTKDSLLEEAITDRCPRLIELLVVTGIPVEVSHIRRAISGRDNNIIDALIKSPNINLQTALDQAINHNNAFAAEKFLRAIHNKGGAPDSANYQKIFQSQFEELKTLARILSGQKDIIGDFMPMKMWEVKKIVEEGDLKTLAYLIDNNINLGHMLSEVVKHIIFGKDRGVIIGYEWFELLDKLSKKDLAAESLDEAMASALINSKTPILRLFIDQIGKIDELPKEQQRIRRVIKGNINNTYMKDHYFEEALSLGSVKLVEMYLEEGMTVKKYHIISIPSYLKNYAELSELLRRYL